MDNRQVDAFNLPALYSLFPSAISPHADSVHEDTVGWLDRFRVFEDESAHRSFYATNIGGLAARFHPDAPPDILQLVSDWYAWMFIRDDERDESELGRQPERLAAANARYLEILKGLRPSKGGDPLAHALWDLRCRLLAEAPTGTWTRRFVRSVKEHFESTVWEATNRFCGVTPDLETYVRVRPITGGLYIDTEFIGITERTHLPPEVWEDSAVRRLTGASNNAVCWANDIISLKKEVERADVHNLVLILRGSQGLTLREAVARATELHDVEVRTFIDLQYRLPSFSEALDANLERYVAVLRARMRGNLDWSLGSGRYRPVGLSVGDERRFGAGG